VFLSNTKGRRAKLTADKLQQLADLGGGFGIAGAAGGVLSLASPACCE
jgi:hypothetical protein